MSDRFPAFFVMSFSFDDDTNITYAFAGSVPQAKAQQLNDDIIEFADWYSLIVGENENQGVHDWCSSPDDRVVCLGSYSTYEVDKNKVHDLMNSWKDMLSNSPEVDGLFGDIVEIPEDFSGTDYDIFNAAVSAGSDPHLD